MSNVLSVSEKRPRVLNYVEISPITKAGSNALKEIIAKYCKQSYEIPLSALEEELRQSKSGLAAEVVRNGDILNCSEEELDREYPDSAFFCYFPERETVSLTPTPFYKAQRLLIFFSEFTDLRWMKF